MLYLVAEAPCGEIRVLHFKEIAVAILRAHPHHLRPGDDAVLPRDAQAALQPRLLSFGVDDLGIDQLNDLVVLVLHHADTAQNAHLRRRQTHAAGIQQRFLHVVQQRVQTAVKIRNRAANLRQAFVPLQNDLSQCHDTSSIMR